MNSSENELSTITSRPINRRGVLKAAAWSAPAIAVAVAAPMASASINNAGTGLSIANAGNIVIGSNTAGGAVTGSFSGGATVINSGIAWSIDAVQVSYELSGPVQPTTFAFGGSPVASSTIVSGAYTWAVLENEQTYLSLELISPLPIAVPADGSVVVPFPTITYATTLTGAATSGNRVRAESQGTVTSGGQSLQDGNFKRFPA